MKKKIFIIGACTLMLCGCGKVPKLENGKEAIIEFKDKEMLSVDDFYKEIKDSFGLETLIGMLDKYIYEQVLDKQTIKDATTYATNSIAQMRQSYETDSELLNAVLYMTGSRYQTVEAYQNSLYRNYLQNEAVEKYVKEKITEDELKKYYETSVYPNMTISHILITPKVKDDMKDEEKEKAEKEAKEKIESIIKELNQAKKDKKDIAKTFEELANKYSEDAGTKSKGGDLGELNLGSLNSKYDELVKSASKLKDGEYSTELITTEAGYHVILKTKTGTKETYEKSLDNMKEKIMEEKLKNSQSLIIEAIKHYRDKYEMKITDSELSRQYGIYMNNLINNAKTADQNKE